MEPWWKSLVDPTANLIIALVGVVVGARLTLWVEAQKGRVRRLSPDTVYVEYKALRKVKDGYIIPGEGRVDLSPEDAQRIKREFRGQVALICEEISAMSDLVPNFYVIRMAPL